MTWLLKGVLGRHRYVNTETTHRLLLLLLLLLLERDLLCRHHRLLLLGGRSSVLNRRSTTVTISWEGLTIGLLRRSRLMWVAQRIELVPYTGEHTQVHIELLAELLNVKFPTRSEQLPASKHGSTPEAAS